MEFRGIADVPSKFRIRLIEDEGIKKQFAVIEELVSKAEGDQLRGCRPGRRTDQRWVLTKPNAGTYQTAFGFLR